ncbi:hypothetical protein [Lacticaseibacillus pantheris]|uniref:hypothetical protein n=1 Tax=Lacticaseibacillus pantheris TaxID=171523 RepID=UPI0006D22954|nr:hypothetical protein [Lacticaseibacillus pantheris]
MVMSDKEQRAHEIALAYLNAYLASLSAEAKNNDFTSATGSEDGKPHGIDIYKAVFSSAMRRL